MPVRLIRFLLALSVCAVAGAEVALAASGANTMTSPNDALSLQTNSASVRAEPVQAKSKVKKHKVKRRVRHGLPSVATAAGLRETPDPLDLSSSVAYMVDQDSGEVFFDKNADVKLPIASVTKLMTALVIVESKLSMKQRLRVTRSDYVRCRARSKLKSGMTLTRADALRVALMSSDNRAAHMLARTYPGGVKAFVAAMNEKARQLGMNDSVFADSTGLSNKNQSTARDLAVLAGAAHEHEIIRRASTTPVALVNAGKVKLRFITTNRLIGDPRWTVGLQKTGFTTAAGRCMVVQSEFAGRRLLMVVLDSVSSGRRADDMLRMRRWLEEETQFQQTFAQVSPYELL